MTKALRALIVEDSEDDADLLLHELRRGAYEPTHARVETAETMRAELSGRPWDIVLSDFSMPKFDAFDALALLQDLGLDLPFIIVSGTIGEDRAVAAMQAGAHDYILKGNLKRLVPAVKRELEQAGQRRARRQAYDELRDARATEARLGRLLDESSDEFHVFDAETLRFVQTSAGARRNLGYKEAELSRMTPVDVSEYTLQEVVAFLEPLRTGEREGLRVETFMRRKDGSKYPVEMRLQYVASEEPPVFVTIAQDITERRVLEGQLQQAQKMEAIGHLAGGIAHDFNNLLMTISGYGQLLASDLDPADERHVHAERILNASDRAARLTRQLLALSRRQVLHPEVLNLNSVVQGIDALLRPLIGDTILLTIALDPELGSVRADPSQLEQVIMNLITNARDAMSAGGRLTIETANVELDNAYLTSHTDAQPGLHVMLAVSDTGIGMDTATMAQLFEPFFTTKEPGKGTGLGLATTYGIVKQSGGNIWVYSEPGVGTTFKVYLPRIEGDERVGETPDRPIFETPERLENGTPLGGNEVVLLVEDDAEVRALVEMMLTELGYTVLSAPDGATALDVAAATDTIALLVTDVMMPGLRGPELVESLGAFHAKLRVLYISGYPAEAVGNHDLLERGANYLEKPFTREALARIVRKIFDGPEPDGARP